MSSNGEISYTYDVIPATHQERVLLSTPVTIGNWDDPRIYITHEQLADVPVGSKLIFYIEPANGAQLQLNIRRRAQEVCNTGGESNRP